MDFYFEDPDKDVLTYTVDGAKMVRVEFLKEIATFSLLPGFKEYEKIRIYAHDKRGKKSSNWFYVFKEGDGFAPEKLGVVKTAGESQNKKVVQRPEDEYPQRYREELNRPENLKNRSFAGNISGKSVNWLKVVLIGFGVLVIILIGIITAVYLHYSKKHMEAIKSQNNVSAQKINDYLNGLRDSL